MELTAVVICVKNLRGGKGGEQEAEAEGVKAIALSVARV